MPDKRHLPPVGEAPGEAPATPADTATLWALMDEHIPVGELRIWRSPVYFSPFLIAGVSVPVAANLIREWNGVAAEMVAAGQLHAIPQGHRTAVNLLAWLALPPDKIEMLWTRDRVAEDAIKQAARTPAGIAIPAPGMNGIRH